MESANRETEDMAQTSKSYPWTEPLTPLLPHHSVRQFIDRTAYQDHLPTDVQDEFSIQVPPPPEEQWPNPFPFHAMPSSMTLDYHPIQSPQYPSVGSIPPPSAFPLQGTPTESAPLDTFYHISPDIHVIRSQNMATGSIGLGDLHKNQGRFVPPSTQAPVLAVTEVGLSGTSVRKNTPKYMCPICSKLYHHKKRVDACLNKHGNERPFICGGECGNRGWYVAPNDAS
ncbi:hypothetical protein FRC19_003907 [Serendipita sp. 401]|nr:hypothetical protein FRC19_003907 [Serendipita sp. 401]